MRWGLRLGRLSLRHRRCFAALSMKFDQHGWIFILSEAKDLRCFSAADERVNGDGGCDGGSAWAGWRPSTSLRAGFASGEGPLRSRRSITTMNPASPTIVAIPPARTTFIALRLYLPVAGS